MAVKVMGITASRKDSNSETLLKEALMYCKEAGADVTMVSLKDYHIKSCTGRTSYTRGMAQGKHTGCALGERDDKKKIMGVMLDQDAVTFSAPTYDLIPNVEYLILAQRSSSYETAFLETIGATDHKDRIARLICAGGSTKAWQSITLEVMQATMFTTDMKVAGMILATQVPGRARCLLDDAPMARTRKMGEHIMKAAATPPGERGWLGDEDMGQCPNCHSNALVLGEPQQDELYYPMERQVCGAGGDLGRTGDGKWGFVIQEDGYLKDRTTVVDRAKHLEEIGHAEGGFYAEPKNLKVVQERVRKYKNKQFKGIWKYTYATLRVCTKTSYLRRKT